MASLVDPPASDHDELRRSLANDLNVPADCLATTRVGKPTLPIVEDGDHDDPQDYLLRSSVGPQFLVGRHLEVVITFQGNSFEIAEIDGVWRGVWPLVLCRRHPPGLSFEQSAALLPRSDRAEVGGWIAEMFRHLSSRRRRRYRRCSFCKHMIPPEYQMGFGCCMDCATTELGVVF